MVPEAVKVKASPSVCHKRRLGHWARNSVPLLLFASVGRIPILKERARPRISTLDVE